MKTKLVLILASLALVASGVVWFVLIPHPAPEKEHEHEEARTAAAHVKRTPTGEPILTVTDETQKRIGLQTATLAWTNLSPELKAYGRVLDAAPLAALVAEIELAEPAFASSSNELARLKALEQSQNASARAIQSAEAVARRDQVALEAARSRLLGSWGKPIASRTDLPAFAHSLMLRDSALVRIDLPAGENLPAPPAHARLAAVSAEDQFVEAKFIGAAPTVDPQTQMSGFLFLVTNNRARFTPGAALIAFLQLPGEPVAGTVVPREVIVRAVGRAWVYVQAGNDSFSRHEIALDRPLANGWFIPTSAAPKEPVVTVGAQQLLSEELKSQISEAE